MKTINNNINYEEQPRYDFSTPNTPIHKPIHMDCIIQDDDIITSSPELDSSTQSAPNLTKTSKVCFTDKMLGGIIMSLE